MRPFVGVRNPAGQRRTRGLTAVSPFRSTLRVTVLAVVLGVAAASSLVAQEGTVEEVLVQGLNRMSREAFLHVMSGTASEAPPRAARERPALRQDLRFCTASDGVRIAYSCVGQGPAMAFLRM